MRRVRRTTPELRLELTPLLDVVFLLLTFFVFAMVLMVRAQVLDVELPALAAGRPGERVTAITVTLDARGGVFVDGGAVEVGELAGELERRRAELGGDPEATPILIAVDEGGKAGRLIEVADALSAAGIARFSVIGRPAESIESPPIAPTGGGA